MRVVNMRSEDRTHVACPSPEFEMKLRDDSGRKKIPMI